MPFEDLSTLLIAILESERKLGEVNVPLQV